MIERDSQSSLHSGLDSSPPPVDVERFHPMSVDVTRDGLAAANALVVQPGTTKQWTTDEQGSVDVLLDRSVVGHVALSASVSDAHIGGFQWYDENDLPSHTVIDLRPMPTEDHEFYTFMDPGTPTNRGTTAQCAHCHVTINEQWYDSPHRTSASNPKLYDLYLGTGQHTESECNSFGGTWKDGPAPNNEVEEGCYVGSGVQPTLNNCEGHDCEDVVETAGCASCHAPGIDGELVGRDLMEAVDRSYEFGTHCDVCHKVESVNPDSEFPGVAGALTILRPDDSNGPLDLENALMFGPSPDVLNPKMGSVQREHYKEAIFCSGCHELHQPVLVPDFEIDLERWPDGTLPVHTTYSELRNGPLTEDVACQSCHMPPNPETLNGADLGNVIDDSRPDIGSGWARPLGKIRQHTWPGPKSVEIDMLSLAAGLFIEKTSNNERLEVRVTTKNLGPGHAIPTGEPLRSLVLRVGAFCGSESQTTVGGHVIPDYGGYLDTKSAGEDWTHWPGAQTGQLLRIIEESDQYVDYVGYGPFGDGTFSPEDKGVLETLLVAEVEITDVQDGFVQTDVDIPEGSRIYRVNPSPQWSTDNEPASTLVGLSGFGFARVLVGSDGTRFVPHFEAVDVVSDNRLLPQQSFTTLHHFETTCDDPEVRAQLLYRLHPPAMAYQRGWSLEEQLMVEVRQ